MMLDRALEDALEEVVREAGQPETVARRLRAWLRQLSEGSLAKEEDVRFLTAACDELDLEPEDAH